MGCIFSSNPAANEKASPVTYKPSTSSAPRGTAADKPYSQLLVDPTQQNHPASNVHRRSLASGTPRDRSTSGALGPRNSAANATSALPNNNLPQNRSTAHVHRRSLASGAPGRSASNNPIRFSAISARAARAAFQSDQSDQSSPSTRRFFRRGTMLSEQTNSL